MDNTKPTRPIEHSSPQTASLQPCGRIPAVRPAPSLTVSLTALTKPGSITRQPPTSGRGTLPGPDASLSGRGIPNCASMMSQHFACSLPRPCYNSADGHLRLRVRALLCHRLRSGASPERGCARSAPPDFRCGFLAGRGQHSGAAQFTGSGTTVEDRTGLRRRRFADPHDPFGAR